MHAPTIKYLLFALGLAILLPACTSVEKLVDSGNYDEAIEIARRQLAGKKKPNPKYITALSEALTAANDRDLRNADRLKSQGSNTDWTRVFRAYRSIDRRQESVRPLLPLVDKHGIRTDLTFVRVEPLIAEARENAAAQTYAEGLTLLERGRNGNKADARAAYQAFDNTRSYLMNYRDINRLQNEAEALGIVYVNLTMENRTGAYLPRGFERDLLAINPNGMDSRWRRFHLEPVSGLDYDYSAKIIINDIQVSPERVTERSFIEEEEVTDGEEYVLDANGNVAKDSLGNDITRPRKVIIAAEVLEVYQTKQAIVTGELQLFSTDTRRIIDRRSLSAEALFENYASTFTGDRRALSSQTRQRLGNRPGPFPTNEHLILQAADQLKPILQEELSESFQLI
ncbi:MAG: hypothetical protein AAFQ37_00340 [Bacteroidota bacterium]